MRVVTFKTWRVLLIELVFKFRCDATYKFGTCLTRGEHRPVDRTIVHREGGVGGCREGVRDVSSHVTKARRRRDKRFQKMLETNAIIR